MTDYECIIFGFVEMTKCRVCDRYIVKYDAGLKGKGRYSSNVLFGNEFGERVLRLGVNNLYGI